jgi:hypothetical protein
MNTTDRTQMPDAVRQMIEKAEYPAGERQPEPDAAVQVGHGSVFRGPGGERNQPAGEHQDADAEPHAGQSMQDRQGIGDTPTVIQERR